MCSASMKRRKARAYQVIFWVVHRYTSKNGSPMELVDWSQCSLNSLPLDKFRHSLIHVHHLHPDTFAWTCLWKFGRLSCLAASVETHKPSDAVTLNNMWWVRIFEVRSIETYRDTVKSHFIRDVRQLTIQHRHGWLLEYVSLFRLAPTSAHKRLSAARKPSLSPSRPECT